MYHPYVMIKLATMRQADLRADAVRASTRATRHRPQSRHTR